jgi:hypothetical protein
VRAAPRARAADSDDGSVSSLASDLMMDCMERWVMLSCLEWIKLVVGQSEVGDAEIS